MVGLVLTREPRKMAPVPATPAPQASVTPTPEPPPQVALAPAPDVEPKRAEPADRHTPQGYMAVQELTAVHFEFDKSELRPEAEDLLSTHAEWLKAHADTAVLIEGHCDERGTAEYNVALGERRAAAVRDYLSRQGIAAERLSTVSLGKERLACTADTAGCHELNRRSEFRVKGF